MQYQHVQYIKHTQVLCTSDSGAIIWKRPY